MIARKYLYLIALARERHFGKAAACHVSPSTLSTGIRELGAVLVETRRAEKRSAFRHPGAVVRNRFGG